MNHKMSSEQILFDILSYAIKHNEFSVFHTNYSACLPTSPLVELFHQACCWDRYTMLDIMVQRGFNVKDHSMIRVPISHTQDTTHEIPILFETLNYGSLKALEFLLSKDFSPDVIHPGNGMSALYYAGVRLGLGNRNDYRFMETLLKYQADVNIQNKEDGKTLLHAFAKGGMRTEYLHMCKRLIEIGADPNIQDDEGNTALHYVQGRFENYSVPNNVLSFFKKDENPIQIDFTRYNKYGVKVCIC
jgi:ankyrin repeat protein